MSEVTLAEATGARSRVAVQLAAVQARRPTRGADPARQAAWLRDKANMHDQIAGYLRRVGDTAGAVEADVLATRCRADATDLTRDDDTVTTILGPCPGHPATQLRTHQAASGHIDHWPRRQPEHHAAEHGAGAADRVEDLARA